ncbi:hypothetical protein [Acidocella sp.]|uniref:hypothetical protein n=1 Tax=Acidocella sp. TaxID=50710 RepID=UPI0026259B83|nr:hypothetical protein [Acidocella sp.]
MIFPKFAVQPASAASLNKTTMQPRARLAATWRQDEDTGRFAMVWTLIDVQDDQEAV